MPQAECENDSKPKRNPNPYRHLVSAESITHITFRIPHMVTVQISSATRDLNKQQILCDGAHLGTRPVSVSQAIFILC